MQANLRQDKNKQRIFVDQKSPGQKSPRRSEDGDLALAGRQ